MCVIIVNATAARSSGALSILNQFLSNIPVNTLNLFYVFVDPSFIGIQRCFLTYVTIDTHKWLSRVFWDEFGIRKWVKNHKLFPSLIISLQNTGVNFDKEIPQLIYYHQPLPLVDRKWNFFRKNERLFFLYNKFYSFFVKRYLHTNSYVVVQIPFIKEAFIRKFEFDSTRVSIIKPNIKNIDDLFVESREFEGSDTHFIYPATSLLYKNHSLIVQALVELGKYSPELIKRIKIHFTFNKENADSQLLREIKNGGFEDNFVFEETMCFEKLLSFYKASHALLFPSYIETFGLPLVEAASFGLPVLVTDLPYARDVIGDYEGACFLKLNNAEEWAKAIARICAIPAKFKPYLPIQGNSWEDFFYLINKLISK